MGGLALAVFACSSTLPLDYPGSSQAFHLLLLYTFLLRSFYSSSGIRNLFFPFAFSHLVWAVKLRQLHCFLMHGVQLKLKFDCLISMLLALLGLFAPRLQHQTASWR